MNRSALRDLVLAAGVGLLLGVNTAWAYLAVTHVPASVWRYHLLRIVLVAGLVAFVAFARAKAGNVHGPAALMSSIRAYSRAAASRPPARGLVP